MALVRLCRINSITTGKSLSGHISDRLSVVLVRAEPHIGYVTERVPSSAAQCQKAWLQGLGKSGHLSARLRQKAPRRYFTFYFIFIHNEKKAIEAHRTIWLYMYTRS